MFKTRLLGSLCLAALGVLGLQGCKHCKHSCGPAPAPCCGGSAVPAVGGGIPAAPVPVAPVPASPAPVGVAPVGPSVPPVNSLPPVSARYGPIASLQCPQAPLPSAPNGVRLAVPAPADTGNTAAATVPAAPLPQIPNTDSASPLPVGIKQFAKAKPQIATGLKPDLDGLDWLQAKGYKTVLHLLQPGEDDAADRRQVEDKRGLKYLSLTVSPAALDRATIDQFNQIVGDPLNVPLFVYDKDGMLAGGMWYLHFRTADFATEEDARTKATRLGLKEDPTGEHKAMWDAIKKYFTGKSS